MDVALQSPVMNYHEALFECATTAWISADAFMSEKLEFRKPAINTCLEIAAASAAFGKSLLDSDDAPMREFHRALEKAIHVLDKHCHNAEHCLITLKCWRQTLKLLQTRII